MDKSNRSNAFNPAALQTGPAHVSASADASHMKFCVALNFIIEQRLMQTKDSASLYDMFTEEGPEDELSNALGRTMQVMDQDTLKVSVRDGGLSDSVFAASLSDQLMLPHMRNSVRDITPVFDGAIAFTIDEREFKKIYDLFPHNHGTLEIFDTIQERAAFLRGVKPQCAVARSEIEGQHLHLDG